MSRRPSGTAVTTPPALLAGLAANDAHAHAVQPPLQVADGERHRLRPAQRAGHAESQQRAIAEVGQRVTVDRPEHGMDDVAVSGILGSGAVGPGRVAVAAGAVHLGGRESRERRVRQNVNQVSQARHPEGPTRDGPGVVGTRASVAAPVRLCAQKIACRINALFPPARLNSAPHCK